MKPNTILHYILSYALLATLLSCESPQRLGIRDGLVQSQRVRAHLKFLSDDALQGRAPGYPGSALAAKYIASQFEEAGLLPASGTNSYFQNVELTGNVCEPTLSVRGNNTFLRLRPGEDFVAWTELDQSFVSLRRKELVFVGYGISSTEFNWFDYSNIDVNGKILLILVNEPISNSNDFFNGDALTYYGRWTYKFEEATKRGAEGVILIHTDELAGYGWNVIQSSRNRELFYIQPDSGALQLQLKAWVNRETAERILAGAGTTLSEIINKANSSSFRAFSLGLTASATIKNVTRKLESANVIGILPGDDPVLKNEYICYTAHYDHLGKIDDTQIFNGAIDNASGTATLIELATAFSESPIPSKRSLLFIATTAEESGLLGSKYYVQNPVVPLRQTVANINLDALNVWRKTRDIVTLGADYSTLAELCETVAREMNMKITTDPNPSQGIFFRSDQLNFFKKGIPAIFLKSGTRLSEESDSLTIRQQWQIYRKQRYHQISDEYDPAWSLAGTAQMGQFALNLGFKISSKPKRPRFKPSKM